MNAFDICPQEPHDSIPVATDMTLRRTQRSARPRQFEFLGASPGKRFGSTLVDQEQSGLAGDSRVDLPGHQSGSHLRNSAHLKDIDVSVRLESGFFQCIPKKSVPLRAILRDANGLAFQVLQPLERKTRDEARPAGRRSSSSLPE